MSEEFADDAPYVLALVDLEEGVRLMTWIAGLEDFKKLEVGMKLRVSFEDVGDGVFLHRFRPTVTK